MSIWISTLTQTTTFHTTPDCRCLKSAVNVYETTREEVNPRAEECAICAHGEQPGGNPGSGPCAECGEWMNSMMLRDGVCIGCRNPTTPESEV